MSRKINTSSQDPQERDGYIDKLLKLIPAEITAAYLAIKNLIDGNEQVDLYGNIGIIVVVLLVAFNVIYLRAKKEPPSTLQIVFTTFALLIWIMSIGGSPLDCLWENDAAKGTYSGIILIFFTLLAPRAFPDKT